MMNNWENNGTEEIGLVTSTPGLNWDGVLRIGFYYKNSGLFTSLIHSLLVHKKIKESWLIQGWF